MDPNGSGGSANLHLAEVLWGRLVDVHEVDAAGDRVEVPVFRDFVIEPNVLTAGSYVLDRNLVTQRERLTILERKRGGGVDSSAFDQLLFDAANELPEVAVKNVGAAPPFTLVPRNACMVLRFDDCLDDDASAAQTLPATVRVFSGYPPTTPFSARVVFDPHHGAVVAGAFHSTRVLVDMTTSTAEANALPVPQDVNPVGLPASVSSSTSCNVSVRVPSEVSVGTGQFQVLTNLAGVALDVRQNGPSDPNSPSQDIVRAVRSGNPEESINGGSNGFLLDLDRPRVVGGWPITIGGATNDPAGDPGFDFLLDLDFTTVCLNAPEVGDVVTTLGGAFLEVTEAQALVGSGVTDLKARSVAFVGNSLTLQGSGLFQAPFQPALTLATGCWVSFLPAAAEFPAAKVKTTAQILLRFSEPMDPATLSPFGDFLVVDGAAAVTPTTHNLVTGAVVPNNDLALFAFAPSPALRHATGDPNNQMHVDLVDPRDLAGNRLRHDLPNVEFLIDPQEPTQNNGAIVLRLDSNDEYSPNGTGPDNLRDLRGQFFYDAERGSIFPRPPALTGWPADRTNPVPAQMTRIANGVSLPLNPLGAKLQTLWRYCDMGWNVRDETKYNLDVVGLSWAPSNGGVQADFFELFEIRLGHSRWLPDEPWGNTGLPISQPFEGNYLNGSNPKVVHDRTLGYALNPTNRFNSTTNVVMMPYPLNRGATPDVTYTWRDTSILTRGADGGVPDSGVPPNVVPGTPGVPLRVEIDLGVNGGPNLFRNHEVRTIGLPLLMEFKCFPSDSGLGINGLDVSIPTAIVPPPNFRALSAGGLNSFGNLTPVLPDSEDIPKGGFNPFSTPPGLTTAPVDGVFYIGQLDTVVRVSRVHTAWLDSGVITSSTAWQTPVLEPDASGQPAGTAVQLDFRSTNSFAGQGATETPFEAPLLNAYGDPPTQLAAADQFTTSPPADEWSSNIALANGRRFLQVRITFVNNTTTGLSPELTSLAFPFTK